MVAELRGVGESGSLPIRVEAAIWVDFLRAGPAAGCVASAIELASLWRFSLDRFLSSYRRKERYMAVAGF